MEAAEALQLLAFQIKMGEAFIQPCSAYCVLGPSGTA